MNSSLTFRPPLKRPPQDLIDDFEQNGDMPIITYKYYNDALNSNQTSEIISEQIVKELAEKISKNQASNDIDQALKDLLLSSRYKINILDKNIAVFGTKLIWIEALAYLAGCSKIFSFDYTRKTFLDSDVFHSFHMLDYLDEAIKGGFIENFENAVSFSFFGNFNQLICLIRLYKLNKETSIRRLAIEGQIYKWKKNFHI